MRVSQNMEVKYSAEPRVAPQIWLAAKAFIGWLTIRLRTPTPELESPSQSGHEGHHNLTIEDLAPRFGVG